jgi:hypothetical protein
MYNSCRSGPQPSHYFSHAPRKLKSAGEFNLMPVKAQAFDLGILFSDGILIPERMKNGGPFFGPDFNQRDAPGSTHATPVQRCALRGQLPGVVAPIF